MNQMLTDGLPAVIPPRSVFRLVRGDQRTPLWNTQIGSVFRIGSTVARMVSTVSGSSMSRGSTSRQRIANSWCATSSPSGLVAKQTSLAITSRSSDPFDHRYGQRLASWQDGVPI